MPSPAPAIVALPLRRPPVFLNRCLRCGRNGQLERVIVPARAAKGDDRYVEFAALACPRCRRHVAGRRRSRLPIWFAVVVLGIAMLAPWFEAETDTAGRRPVRIVVCIFALTLLWWTESRWRGRPRAELHGDEAWFWFGTEGYATEFQRRNDGWRV